LVCFIDGGKLSTVIN